MKDNSAIFGGFAYMRGEGTSLEILNEAKFRDSNAYFGGAFAMYDKSTLDLVGPSI
jgi:hypothetical protein